MELLETKYQRRRGPWVMIGPMGRPVLWGESHPATSENSSVDEMSENGPYHLQNQHVSSLNHKFIKCCPNFSVESAILVLIPNLRWFHLRFSWAPCLWVETYRFAGELHVVLSHSLVQTPKSCSNAKNLKVEDLISLETFVFSSKSSRPSFSFLLEILLPKNGQKWPTAAPPAWDSSSPCYAPRAGPGPRARPRGCPRGRGGREASRSTRPSTPPWVMRDTKTAEKKWITVW